MIGVCDPVTTLLLGIIAGNLTGVFDVQQAFSGFSNSVPWLLFFVVSLSKVIAETPIGLRVAYLFMKCFGRTITGLSYSIILTELLVAPAMPSSTARTASIGLPLISSLTKYISKNSDVSERSIGSYLCLLYSGCSAICSAAYATGMISNVLILEAMEKANINITWIVWFKYAIVPCLLMLLALPFILKTICSPGIHNICALQAQAERQYQELGALTANEKYIIIIFSGMLLMWVFSGITQIPIIITAMIGLSIFIALGMLDMKKLLSSSSTIRSVMVIGFLISYVNNMINLHVTDWFTKIVAESVCIFTKTTSFLILSIIYFLTHFFFSGEGARIVALYAPFLAISLSLGISPLYAAMTLALFSATSNVLTNYTSPVTIMIYSTDYTTSRKWISCGLVVAAFIIIVWHTIALIFSY